MKTIILALGCALLSPLPAAYADSNDAPDGKPADPCINVTIQNDTVNQANVRQNCDRNINRTVQAGASNQAQTIQSGQVNDNKVRQYQYDRSKYLQRLRAK